MFDVYFGGRFRRNWGPIFEACVRCLLIMGGMVRESQENSEGIFRESLRSHEGPSGSP